MGGLFGTILANIYIFLWNLGPATFYLLDFAIRGKLNLNEIQRTNIMSLRKYEDRRWRVGKQWYCGDAGE